MSDPVRERMMRTALAQARRGLGRTHPNPSVGAVVYRGEQILGRGRTRPPGGPHAEIVALADARRRHGDEALRGASIAVTLEPCSFTGRTGPCTDALIAAGLREVIAGVRDPHRRVDGQGFRKLRRAGIGVESGVLEAECRDHHRGFFSVCERGRPWIILKLATSLDGRIATASGESRWITSPAARRFVHALRSKVDGVMVGSGTALADDPALTARRGDRVVHRPVRVLVDGGLRVPVGAQLYRAAAAGEGETLVLCRRGARGRRARAATGARLVEVQASDGRIDLVSGVTALAEAGLTTVLVEGGGGLAAALLSAGLVDEIHWLQAPILIGGDGRPALGPLSLERLSDAVMLTAVRQRRLGSDLHWQARIGESGSASRRARGGSRKSGRSGRSRERKTP